MRYLTWALALSLLVVGCSKGGKKNPVVPPPPDTAPVPNSPANAVKLLEWAQEHRDTTAYRSALTQDFGFKFALGDPAGVSFAGDSLDRAKELIVATHMFVGGGTKAHATGIHIAFDPTLTAQGDDRGFDPITHKLIHTSHGVTVESPGDTLTAAGFTDFYLVRGDVADIPPGLGLSADPNRWWVQEWVDKSILTAPSTRVRPTGPKEAHADTWGKMKAVYYP